MAGHGEYPEDLESTLAWAVSSRLFEPGAPGGHLTLKEAGNAIVGEWSHRATVDWEVAWRGAHPQPRPVGRDLM